MKIPFWLSKLTLFLLFTFLLPLNAAAENNTSDKGSSDIKSYGKSLSSSSSTGGSSSSGGPVDKDDIISLDCKSISDSSTGSSSTGGPIDKLDSKNCDEE